MANPICLSPLKFYDDFHKQNRYRSFAYGHVAPLITNPNVVSPFCFCIGPKEKDVEYQIHEITLYDANTNRPIPISDLNTRFEDAGLMLKEINGYIVVWFRGIFPLSGVINYEGQYFLGIPIHGKIYYSEVFCYTNDISDCLKIEYWNPEGNLYVGGKYPIFPPEKVFHYILLLKSELGKPEYSFEEEATKRLGYSFIESQVSKKTYKFNTIIPEYLCDAMRIIRLCSQKKITCKGETYDAITFNMEVDWQEQGDLASVTCEFDVDNVVTNFGGFKHENIGGDFNNDYNNDYDTE